MDGQTVKSSIIFLKNVLSYPQGSHKRDYRLYDYDTYILKLWNYGGVYVGLPADLTTVAASQSKSTHKGKQL
uniref:Uncharacterized protein n=1 Tax=Dicentrarchus labrax TaxID=13489 RepID=A0A8C4HFK4_DICLA